MLLITILWLHWGFSVRDNDTKHTLLQTVLTIVRPPSPLSHTTPTQAAQWYDNNSKGETHITATWFHFPPGHSAEHATQSHNPDEWRRLFVQNQFSTEDELRLTERWERRLGGSKNSFPVVYLRDIATTVYFHDSFSRVYYWKYAATPRHDSDWG